MTLIDGRVFLPAGNEEGVDTLGWNERSPVFRARLRNRALRYAGHGWAVTPGAPLREGRFDCGQPGCLTTGCHPALERWEEEASIEPRRVAAWWRRHPHAVLLATGHSFDAIEVPAHLGARTLGAARVQTRLAEPASETVRGPVAVTPTGRWMFLVRPGEPLRPELAECSDIVRHGPGSWIPAPPTLLPEGPVRWAVSPEETRWRLPESRLLQRLLLDARDPAPAHRPGPRLARAVPRLRRAT